MPSDFSDGPRARVDGEPFNSVEYLLFDSLVHHLIEKGLMTKNDALSVVQIAAEVLRGRIHESGSAAGPFEAALGTLERTYSSFEALPDRGGAPHLNAHNVHPLRSPLHGDRPSFPSDDN
jgi:hypothetical protein